VLLLTTKHLTMNIQITTEIKAEINNAIATHKKQIEKENAISEDLRYHEKIMLWEAQIVKLQSYLTQGYIN